jgi:hypothetical protein
LQKITVLQRWPEAQASDAHSAVSLCVPVAVSSFQLLCSRRTRERRGRYPRPLPPTECGRQLQGSTRVPCIKCILFQSENCGVQTRCPLLVREGIRVPMLVAAMTKIGTADIRWGEELGPARAARMKTTASNGLTRMLNPLPPWDRDTHHSSTPNVDTLWV